MLPGTWKTGFACPLALLAGMGYLASPLKMGVVCGNSMNPSYRSGKPYVLDQAYYQKHAVERGDVVVFNRGSDTYIKRVLATEGDKIYLIRTAGSDSYDLVMDFQLSRLRRVAKSSTWKHTLKLIERRVPSGCCFVVGDSLGNSVDSRTFGPIMLSSIRGRVVNAPPTISELEHVAGSYQPTNHS